MRIKEPVTADQQVLRDAARMLRAAARGIDKASGLKLDSETAQRWMSEANGNIDAALARLDTYRLNTNP